MNHKIVKTLTACCIALACTARAEQGGTGHYAPGTYLDFSGFPPSGPGWYVANYFLDYNNATFGGNRGLPFGSLIGVGVKANAQGEAPTVMYAFPFDFFGGRLSTGFAPTYEWVTVEAKITLDRNGNVLTGVTRKDTASGAGDVQWIPLMAGWTNGDFSYGGLFNIWAPTGEYNKNQLANVGLGYWTFEPMLAFSWLSQKIGTEVSLFAAVDFNTPNTAADYQSGDIFHLDATVAQHLPLFGGFAGVGASAFYLKQFTGDSGSGARLGSFQAETYGVGPTLSYVHTIGEKTLVVDASWLPQLHSNNTTKGDYWWIKVTLAF